MEALHAEQGFSDMFVAYLPARNIRCEEESVDQLFSSSEKIGPRAFIAGSFWRGGYTGNRGSQDQSGNPSRDDRHHLLASQLFHEPVQEAGFHPLQRRIAGPQFAAQPGSPRLAHTSFQGDARSASRVEDSAWCGQCRTVGRLST